MLNRLLIVKELTEQTGKICAGKKQELLRAQSLMQDFKTLLQPPKGSLVPHWNGELGTQYNVASITDYDVIATDGSQIYPDRHQGIECFLINVGSIHLHYGDNSFARFDSVPFITIEGEGSEIITPHRIDCKRTEMEFITGLQLMQQASTKPALFMCDGSLIFWHLQLPQNDEEFAILHRYFELLEQFKVKQYPLVGYISLPKSRDIIQILSALSGETFYYLADLDIIPCFIEIGHHTRFFESKVPVAGLYTKDQKPYFCYLNTGSEIVRLEIPAWIAHDKELSNTVMSIAYDQSKKGLGYPVALSEAHEQAVVSHADRDFFYQTLQKLAENYDYYYMPSQKSTKKRGMSF